MSDVGGMSKEKLEVDSIFSEDSSTIRGKPKKRFSGNLQIYSCTVENIRDFGTFQWVGLGILAATKKTMPEIQAHFSFTLGT